MFWENLCRLCNERGIKMTNFALEMGLSRGAPSIWKKGKKLPNDTTLVKIADYFGVSKEALLYGGGDVPKVVKADAPDTRKELRDIITGQRNLIEAQNQMITHLNNDIERLRADAERLASEVAALRPYKEEAAIGRRQSA